MEIKFKSLSMRNFLSYGNNLTTLEFSQPGTTLIVGENLDHTSHGNTSNGVGKTSQINALVYALYDKPLSDISKDNLINNINKKNMEVVVEFDIGDVSYKIKRERKAKNGNNAYFWINGEDKTRDSVANTNAAIEEVLGIQYDLFVQIVVFSTSHEPFLKLSKAEQTNMFERLVGLTMLTEKANNLKELIKDTDTSIKIKKAKIEVLEAEHERHAIQLQNAKDRVDSWNESNITNIGNLREQLDSLVEPDYTLEQSIHTEVLTLTNQLTQETNLLKHLQDKACEFEVLQSQLIQIGDIDFEKEQTLHEELSTIDSKITTENNLLAQVINNVADLKKFKHKLAEMGSVDFKSEESTHIEINMLDDSIKNETSIRDQKSRTLDTHVRRRLKCVDELTHLKDNKCPYCAQLFADAGAKIVDLESEIQDLEITINDEQQLIDNSDAMIKTNTNLKTSLLKTITTPNLQVLMKLKNEVDNIVSRIEDLERVDCDVSGHTEVITKLKTTKDAIISQLTTPNIRDLLKIKSDVERIKTKLEERNTTTDDITEVLQSIESSKSTLELLSLKLTTDSIRELMQIKQANDNIRMKLDNLISGTNPHIESHQELLNAKLEVIDYEDINNLTRTLEHQKLLLKLLTKKDSFVRKALLQRYIPYINSRLKYYLSEMSLPHKVEFTPEMAAEISLMGRVLDYGQLSAGQQARLNLSLSLAFSDVLQKLHAKVNVQCMDEILDTGLDSLGVQSVARIIKARSLETETALYVISHRDEVISMFDNIMTIQMIKGFSYIKE